MKAIVVSANEWVYPDITEYSATSDKISVHAPRGGFAAVQVYLTETPVGSAIEVEYSGKLTVSACQMLDVLVDLNTNPTPDGEPKSEFDTRKAPFRVFDVLRPIGDGALTEIANTALYLSWAVPQDASVGADKGKVTIIIAGETVVLDAEIIVHSCVLPRISTLKTTNWYNQDNIGKAEGIELCSEKWFDMYRSTLKLMRHIRQTQLMIWMSFTDIRETSTGIYEFDFGKMKRVIEIALEEGIETLEFSPLIKDTVDKKYYSLFYEPEGRKIIVESTEGYAFLSQLLISFAKFLKENNWYNISVQHVVDEPGYNGMIGDYRALCGLVRKFLPGIPIIEALNGEEKQVLRGDLDRWVPLTSLYQEQRERYDSFKAAGDEIWVYTCCGPTGKWLNRFLDYALLKTRLLHYGNYLFDIKGYLHWGLNFYPRDFEGMRSVGMTSSYVGGFLGAGDCNIIYPGVGNGPWLSRRAEMMRLGCEDFELLWIVAKRNPGEADILCKNVMRAFDDYSLDIKAFDENYVNLLNAADH
ncbi:hypothetical protein FACS1894105_00800 [Clostridia bacterium]|nr:hypothetical protein FACS1894105_00800 [Clostridia bacterium]